MPFFLFFFFIAMLIIGFLVAAFYMNVVSRGRDKSISIQIVMDWDAINDEGVQAALARRNKIEAIKRYRKLTGYDLKDSKDAIDYALLHPDERPDKNKKAAYDAQDAGIRDLIEAGRLDEAVEIYQKFAGVDSYTARDAVDEIARDIHLGNQSASRTTFEVPPTDKSSRN
jgi:hypothetical protein